MLAAAVDTAVWVVLAAVQTRETPAVVELLTQAVEAEVEVLVAVT
jgi:hypothetical protein